MKYEEMYIKASVNQKPKIYEVLENNGFARMGNMTIGGVDDYVTTYENGTYCDLNMACVGYPVYSFDEFISKYGKQNKMIELINKAKSELKMNDSDLSLALGKSRQYIGKMLRIPQTDKVKACVVKEIESLIAREKFKPLSLLQDDNKSKIVDEVKIKINVDSSEIQEIINTELNALRENANEISNNLKSKLSDSKKEIVKKANKIKEFKASVAFLNGEIEKLKFNHSKQVTDLQKTNENQKAVIDKLDDQLIAAEKIHNQDIKLLNAKDSSINELKRDIGFMKQDLNKGNYNYSALKYEFNTLKSSYATSKSLNWFLIVSVILAALWCWYV
jgi:hypothetical protein